jgi:hypothetical protein
VREGYEGLVRGNKDGVQENIDDGSPPSSVRDSFIANLRFGYGPLLRDGEADCEDEMERMRTGRTLKGRYIVRVGWDDVRGWMTEVRVRWSSEMKTNVLILCRVAQSLGLRGVKPSGQSRAVRLLHTTLSRKA